MSTTITALGTVPQKIVDSGLVGSPAVYTVLSEFDTHGAEFIGFNFTYTKGSEASVQTIYEVQLRSTGEWVALPISPTLLATSDSAATTRRAFSLYVGRDAKLFRIRGKVTTGPVNATTKLEIWGMLSAPTFPIVGSVL